MINQILNNDSSELDRERDFDSLIDELEILSSGLDSDVVKSELNAKTILRGLGFSDDDMLKPINHFSGGWKMRLSVARALFMQPTLLLLEQSLPSVDEPTNHLDLHTNLWLAAYLKTYPKTLICVSHDQYFIDDVATTIIHLRGKQLVYYRGNYAKFLKQREVEIESEKKNWKQLEKEIEQMKKKSTKPSVIQEFITKKGIQNRKKIISLR